MGIDALSVNDPSSFSNTEDVIIRHAHIVWQVDFSMHTLAGSVKLTFEKVKDTVDKVVLDTREIIVKKVTLINGAALEFVKGPTVGTFGESLTVKLPSGLAKTFDVLVEYETAPTASALQWLTPEQTAGKTHPYMFSQCQSIHCRSIMPCQDTPYVKLTYSAEVDADADLTVLLSAVSCGTPALVPGTSLRRHKYEQKVTIPSYLLAIVVAKISSRVISPRCNVWAEEMDVDAAAWEFSQAEEQLTFAEEICGPYEWGRYDLLVLPPSFGYGGMENPCVTFVTPTLVVGDRTLADVIAHEISHSWTGNSVGIKTFEHFWLNEGWTMFVQRKIESKLFGEKHRHFSAILGLNELRNCVQESTHPEIETNLVKDLTGIDPEDVFNTVPYEKGHTLLFYLETILGGVETFDPFVKSYCQHFKGKSITTDEFKSYLYEYFASKKDMLEKVDWKTWFFGLGMPPVIPDYDTTLSKQCHILAEKWLSCPEDNIDSLSTGPGFKDLSPLQQREFIDQLCLSDNVISVKKLQKFDEWYNMKTVRNTEVKFRWLKLTIKARWEDKIEDCIELATIQGRMKYVRPLYRSMYAWPAARDRAIAAFKAHRNEYMYITARLVALDLHLDS